MRRQMPRIIQILVTLAMPVALLALTLRIVTGHWLVNWEYGKSSFPRDPYGLDTEQRIDLAETCVDYLVSSAGIELLADLELYGAPAFNERELQHMVDVKRVLWWLLFGGLAAGLIVVGGSVALAANPENRKRAPMALFRGSSLTVGSLIAVGLLMGVAWQFFFIKFHELFFNPGTWMFAYSDTLIRLFPERFWMDVGAVIVTVMTILSITIGAGAFVWNRRVQRPPEPEST